MKPVAIPDVDYSPNKDLLVVTAVRYEGMYYKDDNLGARIAVYFSIVATSVEYKTPLVFTLCCYYKFDEDDDDYIDYCKSISLRKDRESLISSEVADMISRNGSLFAKSDDKYYLYGIEWYNKNIYSIEFDSIQAAVIGYVDQMIMLKEEISENFLIDFVYPIKDIYEFSYRINDKDPDHKIKIHSIYPAKDKNCYMVKFDVFNQRINAMETMIMEPFVIWPKSRLAKKKAIKDFDSFIDPSDCINESYRICTNIIMLQYYRIRDIMAITLPTEMLIDVSMVSNSIKTSDYDLIKFEPNYLSYKSMTDDVLSAVYDYIEKR